VARGAAGAGVSQSPFGLLYRFLEHSPRSVRTSPNYVVCSAGSLHFFLLPRDRSSLFFTVAPGLELGYYCTFSSGGDTEGELLPCPKARFSLRPFLTHHFFLAPRGFVTRRSGPSGRKSPRGLHKVGVLPRFCSRTSLRAPVGAALFMPLPFFLAYSFRFSPA